jgi:hypothetical protein
MASMSGDLEAIDVDPGPGSRAERRHPSRALVASVDEIE